MERGGLLVCVATCALAACTAKNGGGGGGGGGGTPIQVDLGGCAAPRMTCGADCVDLATDAHHCGSCDRDCGTLACAGGLCTPQVLTPTVPAATGPIVYDAGYLYYFSNTSVCSVTGNCASISKCGVAGCTSPFNLVNPAGGRLLHMHAGVLYWLDGYNLRSCPASGQCLNDSAATLMGVSAAGDFVVDDAYITFIPVGLTTVQMCPAGGCGGNAPTTLFTTPQGAQLAPALVSDGSKVFFATGTTLYSVPNDGSAAATELVKGLTGPVALALDANNVYFVMGTGEISSCAKTGCPQPTTLAMAGALLPSALIVDGGYLYWAAPRLNMPVQRCPITGCLATGPTVLAIEPRGEGGIAVDATSIYWTDAKTGVVKRVPK